MHSIFFSLHHCLTSFCSLFFLVLILVILSFIPSPPFRLYNPDPFRSKVPFDVFCTSDAVFNPIQRTYVPPAKGFAFQAPSNIYSFYSLSYFPFAFLLLYFFIFSVSFFVLLSSPLNRSHRVVPQLFVLAPPFILLRASPRHRRISRNQILLYLPAILVTNVSHKTPPILGSTLYAILCRPMPSVHPSLFLCPFFSVLFPCRYHPRIARAYLLIVPPFSAPDFKDVAILRLLDSLMCFVPPRLLDLLLLLLVSTYILNYSPAPLRVPCSVFPFLVVLVLVIQTCCSVHTPVHVHGRSHHFSSCIPTRPHHLPHPQ